MFLPSAARLAGTLGEDYIIYHCVDEYSAFSDIPTEPIAHLEREASAKIGFGNRIGGNALSN